ncbi:MAG TPA: PsbP-related protein [Candidatus Omnitrophota bacterium]|nr:PsbP-related protein [Candidatus Omnitrophota bacterium]
MDRRTKQKIIFALIGILGVLLISYAGVVYYQGYGFRKYTDRQAGFSIQYPREWAYAPNKDGANVIFYTPLESDYDAFQENINVAVKDISANPVGLDEFTRIAIRQMEIVFKDRIEVLESTPYNLGNRFGHKFVFQIKGIALSARMMMVWTVKGDKAFQVTYTAQTDTYGHYMDIVEKMLKSFKLLG